MEIPLPEVKEIIVPIVNVELCPTFDKWKFPSIYYKDANNNDRIWTIEFDGSQLIITHGIVDGKMQIDNVLVVPKSKRNLIEQAYLQAKKRYMDQFPPDEKIMLCQHYKDHKHKVKFPAIITRKYDGIRFTARLVVDNSGKNIKKIVLKTREGKTHYEFPHIINELSYIFDLYPDIILDGELYVHNMELQKIRSIVMRKLEKHQDIHLLNAIIFDIINTKLEYHERYNQLVEIITELKDKKLKSVKIAKAYVVENYEQIDKYFQSFLSTGYEGAIVRNICAHYEYKRSYNVLKMKKYDTYEGYVIDIIGGNNTLGREADLALFVIKWNDITFNCRPRGSFEWRREILENKQKFLDKYSKIPYTFKCLGLNLSGVPNIPSGVCFRDYE